MNSIKVWFRKHRKAVIVTGTILAVVGVVAIIVINGKKVKIPVKELAEAIVPEAPKAAETAAETVAANMEEVMKTFPRDSFIRHLSDGWKASAAKLAQAAELGIDLNPGETLVDACMVNMKVAA